MRLTETHYEKFTARERIALFWDAMGRKDFPEADRLVATCPEKTYRMNDAEYSEGVRAIHDCCLHALLLIEQATGKVLATLGLLLGSVDAEAGRGRERFAKAADGYCAASERLWGYWEAWREFCAGVNVDPEAVMRAAWGGLPHGIADVVLPELQDEIEPDPEAKAQALELFRARWERYQRRMAA